MATRLRPPYRLLSLALLGPLACSGLASTPDAEPVPTGGKADSSAEATFLDFEFDASLESAHAPWYGPEAIIRDQLLYTIGHLNEQRSVGRLDRLTLSDIQVVTALDGHTRISYHAKLPVAWGSKTTVPSTYDFRLPRDVTGFEAFTAKYKDSCVAAAAHEVDSGSMWYYYRPGAYRCELDDGDVVAFTATATPSASSSTGTYPEYDKVWEDGALRVVAIFGKYEDDATSNSDSGISAYNEFVRAIRDRLQPLGMTTTPTDVAYPAGVAMPDITFTAELAPGKQVVINVLLVDNISTAPASFYQRYEALSTHADLIAYNGHAGLGQNVRALAKKGSFVSGQYLMLFMNGCDTYAYVDGSLAETRASLNPDDPTGTKYMDIVTNAMPSFFNQMPKASMALLEALLTPEAPRSYERIFEEISKSQVVLVTGDEDNAFSPPVDEDPAAPWPGMESSGELDRDQEQHLETPLLPAGRYVFQLSGDGDADLYLRRGEAPSLSSWDCRPYEDGSSERCEISLSGPDRLFVLIRGYSEHSTFQLQGRAE